MADRRWQKSPRIYVRTRTSPQSAHLWWPAVAKLQAASVPIAYAAAPWDRQTDGSRYRLIRPGPYRRAGSRSSACRRSHSECGQPTDSGDSDSEDTGSCIFRATQSIDVAFFGSPMHSCVDSLRRASIKGDVQKWLVARQCMYSVVAQY